MEITFLTGIPVIMGLTEVAKRLGLTNRFLPVLNLMTGILWSFYFFQSPEAIIQGVVLGLTAAGLYRSTKVVISNE